MMMSPEPWENQYESMSPEKHAFYEVSHSCLMEPTSRDGPASVAFTDGIRMGACLDRNGLRPSRYYVTKDDLVIPWLPKPAMLDIAPERVAIKRPFATGPHVFLVDTEQGRNRMTDEELKNNIRVASDPVSTMAR